MKLFQTFTPKFTNQIYVAPGLLGLGKDFEKKGCNKHRVVSEQVQGQIELSVPVAESNQRALTGSCKWSGEHLTFCCPELQVLVPELESKLHRSRKHAYREQTQSHCDRK